jgi:hypothetical protein
MIYSTQGEHANHYITDAVPMIYSTQGEHANHYSRS